MTELTTAVLAEFLSELRKENDSVRAAYMGLTEELRQLVQALNRPVKRQATIELPNGQATMVVSETKEH
jgi:hypothetical protein